MQVFHPAGYQFGNVPEPVVFNPTQLDTDQWIEVAKAAGAEYAVLVANTVVVLAFGLAMRTTIVF